MFRPSSQFDKLLEKATSNLLLEPDWTAILQLCDCVRQGDVQPKYAVNAIKKKFYSQNPHVALFAFQVMESCMKNCGSLIHAEVANKPFMEEMRELVKTTTIESVKNKVLELIQMWAHAFRNEPNFRAVQDTLNVMKLEGYAFPVLKESDAMFVADRAPEWADAECCHRCRVQFSVVQRKHHCRNCGQVFCNKCSSKNSTIPKFGIEKEVRVCDACYEVLNKPSHSKQAETDLPPEYLMSTLAMQPQNPPNKSEQELQEEEEFQLALALSKSEAESKEKEKLRTTHNLLSGVGSSHISSAPPNDNALDLDPDLARYLNRPYWEQKQQHDEKIAATTIPSAPVSSTTSNLGTFTPRISEKYQNGETNGLDEFVETLRKSVEIFVNRMKSNSSRGRSIANDTAVQSLFMNVTAMHSQLLKFIQEQEDSRIHYEELQDKLNQIKDARAALDALREDHREHLRREAEEAERQRQIQMAHKLEIMRKKKQEYLEYQRQIALQRMQEQEREMQMRHEQSKYLHGIPTGAYPQAQPHYVPPAPPQTYPATTGPAFPSTSADGSPVHAGYPPQSIYQPMPGYDYQRYNMQAMANTLPQVNQQPVYIPQQMMPPGPPHLSVNSGPQSLPPMHHLPPVLTGQLPANVLPSQQQMQQGQSQQPSGSVNQHVVPAIAQPRPTEAELISFD